MKKKIKQCEIKKVEFKNVILVIYDDGSTDIIGSYYPDELYFSENEFINLTRQQAVDLMTEKDITYLRR